MQFNVLWIFLCFLFTAFAKVSGQVVLEGKSLAYRGSVEVYALSDLLSREKVLLGVAETDEECQFNLLLDSLTTFQRIEIEYGPFNKWMYLGNVGEYLIELDEGKGRVKVLKEPDDQTNTLIQAFSEILKTYLEGSRVNGKRDLEKYTDGLPQFAEQVTQDFGSRGNEFFNNMMSYYVQEREIEYWIRRLPAKKADKKSVEAIQNLPIDLDNPGFWSMIQYFHQNRLHQFVGSHQRRFSTLISVSDLYNNDTLRDLSLLIAYQDGLNRRTLEKSILIEKLKDLETSFDLEVSKQLTSNLIQRYDRFNEGDYFPDFELPTIDGDTIRMTDLLGKPVYIDLFGVWCAPCRSSMKKMPPLVEALGDEIHFLSISFYDEPGKVADFIAENNYDWLFAIAGTDSELEEQLNQSIYPTYVLLDEKGRILDLPALKPGSHQIRQYFNHYFKSATNR